MQTMPADRTNTNTTRPLKPTLATTRTAKTPVAPRLAPSVASSAGSAQPARKPRAAVGSTPRVNATVVHDDTTPVKPFLNNNVTPRSSARKSRVGVASPGSTPSGTPSGTPVTSRPASTVDFPPKDLAHGYSGLGANGVYSAQHSRPRSTAGGNSHILAQAPSRPLSSPYTAAQEPRLQDASSMFFHANDARVYEQPPPPQKKAPVFFYANGAQDDSLRAGNAPSPPLSTVGKTQAEGKFFHADSLHEPRNSPPILTPPATSASPEPWSGSISAQGQHVPRPPSPSKDSMHLSYRKGVSQVLRPNLHGRQSALSIFPAAHAPESGADRSRRRSSVASSVVRLGHGKSASLSSIDSTHSLKKGASHDISITPSPLHHEKRAVSNSSLPESVASAPPEPTGNLSGLPSPGPMSPNKTPLEHVNELAANARRERKVLDLEISNNSLLAINRSLEREVRKQKAELRRFRRMSRAGRFSTDTISNVEEFSAIGVSEVGSLSDMSEEEEQEEEPEDSGDSSFDESIMSADALAERDESHRLRDEKRLQLDLSKHRELLVDSQKMNQSLKRCMNWTEELIKEGKKALEYKVLVSDVRLGGRVLSSEDQTIEEESTESKALLSPWTPPHRATDPLSPLERTDRDSGIDLDGMKPVVPVVPHVISPLGSPLSEMPLRPPPFETDNPLC